jgi:preprotein translocase subunit SecD
MLQKRLAALAVLIVGLGFGWFVYSSQVGGWRPFKLGLDLSGGTHLVYRADTAALPGGDATGAMAALRDTIERRVNLFGVSEPIVQTEKGGLTGSGEDRLIVELPGVTDTQKAIDLIGQTPVLDFRLLTTAAGTTTAGFVETGLSGRYLDKAQLQFASGKSGTLSNEPTVVLTFNADGKALFAKLTSENVGKTIGIFLDGQPISTPVVQEAIVDGTAVITGSFTPDQARTLVRNLNYGALPVPIELISTQTIGSTLGDTAVQRGIDAGAWGVIFVALFMLLWYRLPGAIAAIALCVYIAAMLAIFKLIPVTLSAAGIAGFILSIGMAVDANVLIFERMKEEFASGKGTQDAIHEGFHRAWASIRDSNLSSIITSVILFWFGTSLVKGFALVLGIGVVISMLTAITASRSLLFALGLDRRHPIAKFLYGSGTKTHI